MASTTGRAIPAWTASSVGHRLPGRPVAARNNYLHHTFTNILGKDRDIGYGILRIDEAQMWHPVPAQPGVRLPADGVLRTRGDVHDLEVENIVWAPARSRTQGAAAGHHAQGRKQALKDYVLFPPHRAAVPADPAGNATANLMRNLWTFKIIFCGHFPAGVATFTEEECETSHAATGTSASCSARPTSPAASCSTSCPATCPTRSSTTCSRTSRPVATRRSRSRSRRSASSTAWLQHRRPGQAAVQRREEDLPLRPTRVSQEQTPRSHGEIRSRQPVAA